MPESKPKYSLKEIDEKLETYRNVMSRIDEQILKLKQYRSRCLDKYSLCRFYRVKVYGRDILSINICSVNEIFNDDSEKPIKPETDIEIINEEEEDFDDEFGGEDYSESDFE